MKNPLLLGTSNFKSNWSSTLPGGLGASNSSSTQSHLGYYDHKFSPPHYDAAQAYQFITYHLADSLPQSKLAEIQNSLKNFPPTKATQQKQKIVEQYLDAGYGSCVLKNPECARLVISAWEFFNTTRYDLGAWVVMPNHVHVLIRQYAGWSLGQIVQSWKNYTAKRISQICSQAHLASAPSIAFSRTGVRPSQGDWERRIPVRPIWQRGYWDRAIRNERHFCAVVEYIYFNPVKAGLVADGRDWAWSSRLPGASNLTFIEDRPKPQVFPWIL